MSTHKTQNFQWITKNSQSQLCLYQFTVHNVATEFSCWSAYFCHSNSRLCFCRMITLYICTWYLTQGMQDICIWLLFIIRIFWVWMEDPQFMTWNWDKSHDQLLQFMILLDQCMKFRYKASEGMCKVYCRSQNIHHFCKAKGQYCSSVIIYLFGDCHIIDFLGNKI